MKSFDLIKRNKNNNKKLEIIDVEFKYLMVKVQEILFPTNYIYLLDDFSCVTWQMDKSSIKWDYNLDKIKEEF